jgi:hypothetical protein
VKVATLNIGQGNATGYNYAGAGFFTQVETRLGRLKTVVLLTNCPLWDGEVQSAVDPVDWSAGQQPKSRDRRIGALSRSQTRENTDD